VLKDQQCFANRMGVVSDVNIRRVVKLPSHPTISALPLHLSLLLLRSLASMSLRTSLTLPPPPAASESNGSIVASTCTHNFNYRTIRVKNVVQVKWIAQPCRFKLRSQTLLLHVHCLFCQTVGWTCIVCSLIVDVLSCTVLFIIGFELWYVD
jgi:hypothetical protein